MLEVVPVKAFDDNYLWLIKSGTTNETCIVDPGDARVVLDYLHQHKLILTAIFITHHHADHTGGIARLLEEYNVPVYGPQSANIPLITSPLHSGDVIKLFNETFHVLEIPGHTLDHIAYYSIGQNPVLFCGDTLFAGGCGRVFEGTYQQMHESLQKLAVLAPQTNVFCAHEYTMANLAFAAAVSPHDQALNRRIVIEQDKRDSDIPTIPTSIQLELNTNPFLRCNIATIKKSAEEYSAASLPEAEQVFSVLRQWKDTF